MAFRFYLDGQLTDQPMNDTDLSTSARRDNNLSNLTITQDIELEYNGNNQVNPGEISGYQYLYSKFFDSGCSEIEVRIYDELEPSNVVLFYLGIIKVPSIKIDLQRVVLKTKIQDNNYYSFINNNRNVPVNLAAEKSKNLLDVLPINKYNCDLFNSVNGIYYSTVGEFFQGYKIYDAFDIIVRALSDNKITFQSNFLANLTEVPFIFSWGDLRNVLSNTEYNITFDQLFDEMNKIYSLFYYFDTSDPENPILRIEDYDSSFNGSVVYSFADIKELNVSYDLSNYISDIDVGSEFVTTGTAGNYPFTNDFTYDGWAIRNVYPSGQCNVNTKLNLINKFCIHNNTIQDVVVMNTGEYSYEYFLIACGNVDDINFTAEAIQYDPFNAGDTFYNIPFNNYNKLQRHSTKFTSNLGNFLNLGVELFRAVKGTSSANNVIYQGVGPASPYLMPNVGGLFSSLGNNLQATNESTLGGFDLNGNYDPITFQYTAPLDGEYSFAMQLKVEITGLGAAVAAGQYFKITIYLGASTGVGAFITAPIQSLQFFANGTYVINVAALANLLIGDTVEAFYDIQYYYPLPLNQQDVTNPRFCKVQFDSFFECNGSPGGSIIPYVGDTNVRKYLYEFEYDINQSDFLQLKSVITQPIQFEKDGVTNVGWIDSIKRNDWTGITTIKLVSNNASITQ